jgi:hypothetical protein
MISTLEELQYKMDRERFAQYDSNGHFLLRELIFKIELCLANKQGSSIISVRVDGDLEYPKYLTCFCSYRGYYQDLAIICKNCEKASDAKLFLKELKKTIGKTFGGWKGGAFTMKNYTPVWLVTEEESCTGNFIKDVITKENEIIIIGKKEEEEE